MKILLTITLVCAIIASVIDFSWWVSDGIRMAREIEQDKYNKWIWLYVSAFWWGLFYYLS